MYIYFILRPNQNYEESLGTWIKIYTAFNDELNNVFKRKAWKSDNNPPPPPKKKKTKKKTPQNNNNNNNKNVLSLHSHLHSTHIHLQSNQGHS